MDGTYEGTDGLYSRKFHYMDGCSSDGPKRSGDGFKVKDLLMMPARLAIALQEDGWWVRSDIIWAKPNPMPESVTDRPTSAHEHVFLLTKSARYFYDADAVREPVLEPWRGQGEIDIKRDYQDGGDTMQSGAASKKNGWNDYFKQHGRNYNPAGRNLRNVWNIPTAPYKDAHFATFPPALPMKCIMAGTSERGCCAECGKNWVRVVEKGERQPEPENRHPLKRLEPGQAGNVDAGNMGFRASKLSGQEMAEWKREHPDKTIGWKPSCSCEHHPHDGPMVPYDPVPCTVLDPFSGSATTGLVALKLGRRYIGIELNPEYQELAIKRITQEAEQGKLF